MSRDTPKEGATLLQPLINRNLKNTDFLDFILNVLCDLPFNQNQPLKLADDQYITIFKNKIKKDLRCLRQN
jgi:hypothetical protein